MNSTQKRYRDEMRCTQCGKQDENTLKGRYRCVECTQKAYKYSKDYYANLSDDKKNAKNQASKDWRKDLRERHLCTRCKQMDAYTMTGRAFCAECAEKEREKSRERRESSKRQQYQSEYDKGRSEKCRSEGICTRCRKRPVVPGFTKCAWCRAKIANKARKKRIDDGVNYPRGANGYCWQCNKQLAMEGKKLCAECYAEKTNILKSIKTHNSEKFRKTNELLFSRTRTVRRQQTL